MLFHLGCEKNAFYYAAREGHLGIVKYIVDKGVTSRISIQFAIAWAARHGQLHVVKYLKHTEVI